MNHSAVPVIALDGPSASGKGTIAQRVARNLGYHYLDSGALYRLVALASVKRGIGEAALTDLGRLAGHLDVDFRADGTLWLEGENVTEEIRQEACGKLASRLAALPAVRLGLLERQHQCRRPPGLVADGRDMGTVVFPDAEVKVFLTASAEERARRRYNQLKLKGISANIDTLLQDIAERDQRDSSRQASPLSSAEDAQTLDTTGLSIEQVVDWVMAEVLKAGLVKKE
jgi:cytidylate kinase